MSLAKHRPIRSEKLLALANGQSCMVRIPNVCNNRSETTVWAHSNLLRHGKGTGVKASDCFGCFCCGDCHKELDHGKLFSKEQKEELFMRGFERTLLALWESGRIRVA